jgi:phospholipid-binding lipoprotein MlaA
MRQARGWLEWAFALALPLVLGACAGMPRDASLPVNDPNEQFNRHVMAANQAVMGPASVVVNAAIPGPVHDRLRDFNSNLKEPRIFANNLLQGRFDAAAQTGARFVTNSVLGLGGLFDVASRAGLEQKSGDFGQTLFVWGVAEGPYVVQPYLGPATLRDAVGSTVDMIANPVGWAIGSQVVLSASTSALDAAEKLGQLKQAEDASIDFYSFVRSSYYQIRRAQLREAIGQPNVIDSPALDDPDAPELTTATVTATAPATGSATATAPTPNTKAQSASAAAR